MAMTLPLSGLRVVELGGIGPGPHAAMQLADMGAEVLRVVRPGTDLRAFGLDTHVLRGRTNVFADLKDADDESAVAALVAEADVLIEGFRPGVAERLGLGPERCMAENPRLVYARMTGWGQTGPLADSAGHDINYLSITGVLNAIGPKESPVPPLNLIGDYGGGSMMLVAGVLAALWSRSVSGTGRVIDVAMVDGVAALAQPILEQRAMRLWNDQRASNQIDGAAPFYRTYVCSDGGFMAVGAVEPQFYALFLRGLGMDDADLPPQGERESWDRLAELIARRFAEHPRQHWTAVFEGTDACVTPVLSFDEAVEHGHIKARRTLSGTGSDVAAAAAPRFGGESGPSARDTSPSRVVPLSEAVGAWATR
jgi:alpha-methylacyl-CoA racemase